MVARDNGQEICISQPKNSSSRVLPLPRSIGWPAAPTTTFSDAQRRLRLKLQRKTVRRKLVRYSIIAMNLLVLFGVTGFIIFTPQADGVLNNQALLTTTNSPATISPLDQLSAASVAVTVAQTSRLAEATAVKNQADTDNAEMTIVPAGDTVVSKPQVVSAALKSRLDIQTYVAQAGDTVSGLAVKFSVSSDSIKWSNGLSSDAINAGTKLTIPPVNGFTYTVKSGDTAASLAKKYNANADQITAFNDAEIAGLKVGELIVIPGGQQPVVVVASSYSRYSGGTATYGYNGYDYGYCTYWVAARRAAVGSPMPSNLGNASSWGFLARAYGMSVGNSPQLHAAAVTSTSGAGHVVFIEAVNSDASISVSEMNHAGWNVTDTRTFSADQASDFTYIY